ncbi:hypothetical protein RhiirA1_483036 [Rhizophagus irregularis]|uniref:Fumarylacetoacetase-like C-terminal domain-containing protein n=1 Tax=Rhizophagus irregularis TaxID=588596 RepID=A0A2N0QL33_9GLOM|nr:hypothetical protein RhiirA1_483036 [Rhizophagus irregularis]
MTLLPVDIISTGTPGAVVISDGDSVECHIDGFPMLANTPILVSDITTEEDIRKDILMVLEMEKSEKSEKIDANFV